jgi:S1-C subfamily serine protease
MKKLLGFIFLSLFYCNLGFADVFLKNCKSILNNGEIKILDEGEKREYFVSYNDGIVYYTKVNSEFYLKVLESIGDSGATVPTNEKVTNYSYKIKFADEDEIVAVRTEEADLPKFNHYSEITINLKTNRVSRRIYADTVSGKKLVKQMKEGIKNYPLSRTCDRDDNSNSTDGGSGTAFFINNRGNLITNNHVVEGCKTLKINYFNKELEVDLISTDKTLDLALLKVKLEPKSFISFSKKEPKKRQVVIVAGYPLGQYLSDDLKINEGKISSLKGFENNSNEITVDLAINPGNSGGPIVNENGQLVAVAVAGMSKEVTEGISFGIKSSAVTNFLKTNKINSEINRSSFSMNDEKVNELLEESTVYISCEL